MKTMIEMMKNVDIEKLAIKLLSHVYTSDLSIVVCINGAGDVIDCILFDPAFGTDALTLPASVARAALLVNQPEGLRQLSEADNKNLVTLRQQAPEVIVYRVCEHQCELCS